MTSSLVGLETPSSTTAAPETKAAAKPETTQEQRSEVHRKLGRCLLRLQQYEMLTKAMLVDRAFEFARQAVPKRSGLYTVYRTSAKKPMF